MLQVSGEEIDQTYIAHWAEQLDVTREWRTILDRLAERKLN